MSSVSRGVRRLRRPRRLRTAGPPSSDLWLVAQTESAPVGPLPVVVASPGERRHTYEFVLLAPGGPETTPMVAAGRDQQDWVSPSAGRPMPIAIWNSPAAVGAWSQYFRPDKPAPDGWGTLFATEAEAVAHAGRDGQPPNAEAR